MMAGQRRGTRPSRSGRAKRVLWRWSLLALTALTFAGILYGIYLDHVVKERFDGRRWNLPAQVFGRPMELYIGASFDGVRLTQELESLGYQRVSHPDKPGSYSSYQGRFLLRTRAFHFPDEQRPSDYLEVRFSEGQLISLKQAANGRPVIHYRLEPRLVGSIHPAHSEDRILLKRSELPKLLVDGLMAVEDKQFFSHPGIDPLAILRAAFANLRAAQVVQGGSTLTQQLVKNFFLTSKRSYWRKFNEVMMAVILDASYSKDEILEAYANEIYLGQDGGRAIHGFGLASHFYFNRPLAELDLPQLALLVALVRGPSAYDPFRHPQRATERRSLVLRLMAEQGVVSSAAAEQAAKAPLGIQQGARRLYSAPAFIDLVRRQLRQDYAENDLTQEGLRIFSTLDPWVQSQAEKALSRQLEKLEKVRKMPDNTLQGAVVLADAETGDLAALVGDRSPGFAGFNRALDALRPVGSLLKPAVYLTALERPASYTLVSRVQDQPIRITGANKQVWEPGNYDRKSHGDVTLMDALAHSYNQATVRLGMAVGLKDVLKQIHALGIQRSIDPFPSVMLGGVSLSPLEMAQMYQTLAANGRQAALKSIRAVTDKNGKLLSRYPTAVHQTVNPQAVFVLNHALHAVTQTGTGHALPAMLPRGVRVAGKTGTTDQLRDSWFAGFDRKRVAVVWLGRDDNQVTGLTGSSGALPVWGELMRNLGVTSIDTDPPAGVTWEEIDPNTGLLGENCPEAELVPFVSGSAPRSSATCGRSPSAIRSWLDELLN